LKEKKKGRAAVKQTHPKRKDESRRQLNFSKMRVRNQQVILKFSRQYRGLSFDQADSILLFVSWLQDNKFIIRRRKNEAFKT